MTAIVLRFEGTVPAPFLHTSHQREQFPFSGTTGWCARCDGDLADHLWQVVDPDLTDQGGILDCGRAGEGL